MHRERLTWLRLAAVFTDAAVLTATWAAVIAARATLHQWWPVDALGAVIDIAAFGTDGFRDAEGRAIAPGGALYYEYFDAKRTLLSELFLLGGGLVEKDVLGKTVFVLDGLRVTPLLPCPARSLSSGLSTQHL